MPYIKVGQENSAAIELYYEDHGSGRQGTVTSFTSRRSAAVLGVFDDDDGGGRTAHLQWRVALALGEIAQTAQTSVFAISEVDLWSMGASGLRRDLRKVTREIRPDWDLAAPGLRENWEAGDHSMHHPYQQADHMQTVTPLSVQKN